MSGYRERSNLPNHRCRHRSGDGGNRRYHNHHSQSSMGGGQSRQYNDARSLPQFSNRSQSVGRIPNINPTLDFIFLRDFESVQYINGSKVMFIMRGLPGSGKSTLAHAIQAKYDNVKIISADNFFMTNGKYKFDPSRLPEAHDWCNQQTFKACEGNRFNIVIVDNTNIQLWEMESYFNIANATNYIVCLVEPKTSWRRNLDELKRKNIHNIPFHVLKKKLDLFEDVYPMYFGWFLNEADSAALNSIAQVYLEECTRHDEFNVCFRDKISNYKDLKSFFHISDDYQKIYHCTASFTGDEVQDDYGSRKSVLNALGKVYTLNIIGFFITPRTFGARLKLDNECLKLWNQKDTDRGDVCNLEELVPSMGKLQLSESSKKKEQYTIGIGKKHTRTSICIPTLHWKKHQDNDKRFRPTYGKGSRAHFTLGCASNVKNVQTGFDLVSVIDSERQLGDKHPRKFFHVQNGIASYHDNGQWVIYLDKQIVSNAIFASSY